MIPPFDERGNLPPGVHKADWTELEAAFQRDRDTGEPKGIVEIDLEVLA